MADSDSEYDSDSKKETSPLYYIGGEAKKKIFFETLPPSFQKRFFIFSVEFVAKWHTKSEKWQYFYSRHGKRKIAGNNITHIFGQSKKNAYLRRRKQ